LLYSGGGLIRLLRDGGQGADENGSGRYGNGAHRDPRTGALCSTSGAAKM
jgi:hypothetical protein